MFENVQFFSHLHFKIAKSAIMTPNFFFLKNINMGIKNTQNFMLISNSLMPTSTNAPKKLEPKNCAKFEFFRFCAFFRGFLLLTFVRGISESRHQWIWNQHKILHVFDTHNDNFQEKKIVGHNSTFCNFKMQMRKNLYIFQHFAKSKKLFFSKYLSFSVWFPLSLKHWSPLLVNLSDNGSVPRCSFWHRWFILI